jgi:HPr kinase/phosphorylase
MAECTEDRAESVTVCESASAPAPDLDLEIPSGYDGLDNEIRAPHFQKLGLALAGFTGYIHPGPVHVFGGSEMIYLRILEPERRSAAIQRLHLRYLSCIVVTKELEPLGELLPPARRDAIPVLRTSGEQP